MTRHNAVLATPSVALMPGLRLRTEVGVALHDLEQGGEAVMGTVRDNLRGALAYTAAIGETCMLARAAEAVRTAVVHLDAGELDLGCAALTDALVRLEPRVAVRV